MEDVYKPGQKHCRDDVMPTATKKTKQKKLQIPRTPSSGSFLFRSFSDRASPVGRAHTPVPRRAGIVPPLPGATAEPKTTSHQLSQPPTLSLQKKNSYTDTTVYWPGTPAADLMWTGERMHSKSIKRQLILVPKFQSLQILNFANE